MGETSIAVSRNFPSYVDSLVVHAKELHFRVEIENGGRRSRITVDRINVGLITAQALRSVPKHDYAGLSVSAS